MNKVGKKIRKKWKKNKMKKYGKYQLPVAHARTRGNPYGQLHFRLKHQKKRRETPPSDCACAPNGTPNGVTWHSVTCTHIVYYYYSKIIKMREKSAHVHAITISLHHLICYFVRTHILLRWHRSCYWSYVI